MTYNFHSDLSIDFSQLLETEIDYNVVIQVGKAPEESKDEIPGHEKPPIPPKKVPGQEKPMPTEKRTKMPGQERSASMLLQKEREAIQAFEGHEEFKGGYKEFHVHSNILRVRSK